MSHTTTTSFESIIMARLIKSGRDAMSAEAARALLAIEFDAADRERMHELAIKAQDGTLLPAEQQELEGYRRVGYLLDLLRSRARMALAKRSQQG